MTLIFAATTGWTKPAQCSAKTADYIKLSKSPQIHIPPTGPGCSQCVGAHGRHEHARYCLADSGSSIFRRPFVCLRLNLLRCKPELYPFEKIIYKQAACRSDSRIRHLFAEQGTHIALAVGRTSDSRIRPTRMMLPNCFYFVRLFFRMGINKERPSESLHFQTAFLMAKPIQTIKPPAFWPLF